MATCVFDDIASKFEVGTKGKDDKKDVLTPAVSKDDKDKPTLVAPAAQGKTWEINDLLLTGIVLAIVILSCTALVYAARH